MPLSLPENWKANLLNNGAVISDSPDTLSPTLHFGAPSSELKAPGDNLLTDISYLGLILISGADAAKFLQGQLSCDVMAVDNSSSTLGAYCNLKGRMVSLFRLFKSDFLDIDGFCLQCPADTVESTIATLKKYAMFSKVEIRDISGDVCRVGLSTEGAGEILGGVVGSGAVPSGVNQCEVVEFEGGRFLVSRIPGVVERFEIYSADVAAMSALWSKLSENIVPSRSDNWLRIDIACKIPQVASVTQEALLPHHVNLPELGGVNFKKGCYLGQEIVARMEYKGNIKKHLCVVEMSGEVVPEVGDELVDGDGKAAGVVVTACEGVGGGFDVLACVNDGVSEELWVKE